MESMTLQEYFAADDTPHANANQLARALSESSGRPCPAQTVYKWLSGGGFPVAWIGDIIRVTGGRVTADSWHKDTIATARKAATPAA